MKKLSPWSVCQVLKVDVFPLVSSFRWPEHHLFILFAHFSYNIAGRCAFGCTLFTIFSFVDNYYQSCTPLLSSLLYCSEMYKSCMICTLRAILLWKLSRAKRLSDRGISYRSPLSIINTQKTCPTATIKSMYSCCFFLVTVGKIPKTCLLKEIRNHKCVDIELTTPCQGYITDFVLVYFFFLNSFLFLRYLLSF